MTCLLPSEGKDRIMAKIKEAQLKGYKELDISELKIKYLPIEVTDLHNVTTLKAVSCNLEAINYWPPNVVNVNLCNNLLDESSIDPDKIPLSIRMIDLSYNQFSEFKKWPDSLTSVNLSGHDSLATSDTDSSEYPTVIIPSDCDEFIMTDSQLDDDVIKDGIIKFNNTLTILNLNDNILEDVLLYIPQDCRDNLKELYLDDNRICHVDLSHWSNLETVSLSNNLLDDTSIFSSSILTAHLDLNQFTDIPHTLIGATNISIARNHITELIDFPSDDLKVLDVSGNDIKKMSIDVDTLEQFIYDDNVDSSEGDTISVESDKISLLNLLTSNDDDDFDLYGGCDKPTHWSTQAHTNTVNSWQKQNNRFTVTTHHSPPSYSYHNRSNYKEIKHNKLIIV